MASAQPGPAERWHPAGQYNPNKVAARQSGRWEGVRQGPNKAHCGLHAWRAGMVEESVLGFGETLWKGAHAGFFNALKTPAEYCGQRLGWHGSHEPNRSSQTKSNNSGGHHHGSGRSAARGFSASKLLNSPNRCKNSWFFWKICPATAKTPLAPSICWARGRRFGLSECFCPGFLHHVNGRTPKSF